jgi:hypothetical protein
MNNNIIDIINEWKEYRLTGGLNNETPYYDDEE